MNEELKQRIENKKKYIANYIELSKQLGIDRTTREKMIDMLLQDLSKLQKQAED